MILIDGKEAGGQVLRTAVGLSAITNKPIKVINIRGARGDGGLKTQHLEGILAVGNLCNAKIKGAVLGSKELEFIPGRIEPKQLNIKISTAGSIGLLFQSLQTISGFCGEDIKINVYGGSTSSAWSPTLHYIQNVFLPIANKMGFSAEIKIIKEGFYPKGGAEVKMIIHPIKKLTPIKLTERGKIKNIRGISIVGSLPKHVAERQNEYAIKVLKEHGFDNINISYQLVSTLSPGTSITIWAECENSIIGADNIGRRGVRAEKIGEECAKELIASLESKAALDKYMADQILVFLSLADGESEIRVEEITEHVRTNIKVIEQIVGVRFYVDEDEKTIRVIGIGLMG
ncbi:MAG: RNA 3'-terminal phosphate cyclase [Candidatus Aenigmatarchaeota archaeon]